LNTPNLDLYDLTRMQVQPYWYPNHLLMPCRRTPGRGWR
jgi:hypothetical protein